MDERLRLRQIATADRQHMGVPGSVTDFAAHACFGDLDFMVWRGRHRARRMALEAALNRKAGTPELKSLAHCLVQCLRREGFVLWRDIESLRIRVVRKRVLDVEFDAGFADERHRVSAGAKSPIDG